jgi:hypothetical protein
LGELCGEILNGGVGKQFNLVFALESILDAKSLVCRSLRWNSRTLGYENPVKSHALVAVCLALAKKVGMA